MYLFFMNRNSRKILVIIVTDIDMISLLIGNVETINQLSFAQFVIRSNVVGAYVQRKLPLDRRRPISRVAVTSRGKSRRLSRTGILAFVNADCTESN